MQTDQQQPEYKLTTEEFAARQRVRPGSVRARLCNTGSYFGKIPKRHANGRLLWPDEVAEGLQPA